MLFIFALVFAVGFSSRSLADDFGVKTAHIVWSAQTPDRQDMQEALSRPAVIRETTDAVWTQIRSTTCDAIKQQLAQPGALPNNMKAANISCMMSERGTLQLEPGWQPVRFVYSTTGNSLSVTVSVFSIASVVAMTYDLRLVFDVNVFANGVPLTVLLTNASISNVRGQGPVAVLSTLIPLFSAQLTEVWKSRMDLKNGFAANLAPLNQQLRPPAGYVPVGHWVNKLSNNLMLAFAPQNWPGRLMLPPPPLNRDIDAAWLANLASVPIPNTQTKPSFLDSGGLLHACISGTGQIRVVLPSTACQEGETRIQWPATLVPLQRK